MREAIAFAIVFTALFFVPMINDRYAYSTIREKKVIDGFNEYETRLIKNFKNHIDDYYRNDKCKPLGFNNTISFYMPTAIDSVDLDRVRLYINITLNMKYLIEDIQVKYNKSHTKVNWYVVKYSRRYN